MHAGMRVLGGNGFMTEIAGDAPIHRFADDTGEYERRVEKVEVRVFCAVAPIPQHTRPGTAFIASAPCVNTEGRRAAGDVVRHGQALGEELVPECFDAAEGTLHSL